MYDPSSVRPGDVILVRRRSLLDILGLAIEIAQASPYVHAALVGDGHLIEALGRVVRSPLEKYAETADRFEIGTTSSIRKAAVHFAEERVGTPYGVSELLDDAARFFLHLPVVYPWNARRQTCSGLVAYAYRQAGHPLTWAPAPAPVDLAYSVALRGTRH